MAPRAHRPGDSPRDSVRLIGALADAFAGPELGLSQQVLLRLRYELARALLPRELRQPGSVGRALALGKKALVCLRAQIESVQSRSAKKKLPVWLEEGYSGTYWDLRQALSSKPDWLQELKCAPLREMQLTLSEEDRRLIGEVRDDLAAAVSPSSQRGR